MSKRRSTERRVCVTSLIRLVDNHGHGNVSKKTPNTECNADVFTVGQDYSLNLKKMTQQKLTSAERDDHFSLYATDGGIRCKFQAGLYEHFKRATVTYFEQSEIHEVTSTRNVDQKNYEVLLVLRIKTSGKSVRVETRRKDYTLNLYHTTSSFLANGANPQHFIEKDFQNIMKLIHHDTLSNRDITKLNNKIKHAMAELLKADSF